MGKIKCTIYDCEFDRYCKAVLRDHIVNALDDEENEVPAREYICEYVDFGWFSFIQAISLNLGLNKKTMIANGGIFCILQARG